MLETGLRVSDAVKFDPKRCVKSKYLWVYSFHPRKAKKNETPKLLDVYLTAKLEKENRRVRVAVAFASIRVS